MGGMELLFFWWSELWNVSTWAYGAAFITLGATIRDALLVVFFANLVSAIIIVLNGWAAARYHVGYPVLSRSSFGIYGQYFVVVLRSILGIIWGGVQLYFEGQFISVCLRCIFPGWERIPNTTPAKQQITTQVRGYGRFLPSIPLHCAFFVHTHLEDPASVQRKSVIMPAAGLGIVIWATTQNGGGGSGGLEDPSAKSSTSIFAWGIIAQFNAVMGANSTLLVTAPDLARYSKTKNAQLWGQLISLPIRQTICAAFGAITTSAVLSMYGEAYWNPYDLLNGILDQTYSSKARAGVFFASASFAFATLGTSIACNFIPFAADVTSLLPRYLNIVRGQLLCLVIAFAIVPWRIVATAHSFLNFLGGYLIFMFPVVGVMLVDYFIVRNGNLTISELFTRSRSARYYYFHGFNLRAFAAFIIGFLLPLPGFAASFGYNIGPAALHIYAQGWILSLLMGCVAYYVICLIWKVPSDDGDHGFEDLVGEAQQIIVEGVGVEVRKHESSSSRVEDSLPDKEARVAQIA